MLLEASADTGEDAARPCGWREIRQRPAAAGPGGETAAPVGCPGRRSAERNLTVARVLEAHSDALAILAEAGPPTPDGTWGVSPPRPPRTGWRPPLVAALPSWTGVKPGRSLAGQLDYALVTAHEGEAAAALPASSLIEPRSRGPAGTVGGPRGCGP